MAERKKKLARLRVCASCEWVFLMRENDAGCPKCGFGSYGARYTYGPACYRYALTQEPWRKQKMFDYSVKLDGEIIQAAKERGFLKGESRRIVAAVISSCR